MRGVYSQAWRSSSNCIRCRSISSFSMLRSLSRRRTLASITAPPELLPASTCAANTSLSPSTVAAPPLSLVLLPLLRCAFGGGVRPIPRRLLKQGQHTQSHCKSCQYKLMIIRTHSIEQLQDKHLLVRPGRWLYPAAFRHAHVVLLACIPKATRLRGARWVWPAHEGSPRDVLRPSCSFCAKLRFIISVMIQIIGVYLGG